MLDESGSAGVSLRELSREVGLAKSNVVRYFPTREAVFLAVLIDDWRVWLTAVEANLPVVDRRRRARTRALTFTTAVASTLAEHPRFCDLIVACQTVLEHNVPAPTAREFKTAALDHLTRLASLAQAQLPELADEPAFAFAGITWALTAGAWPMAHPAAVVAEVLEDAALAPLKVEFVPALAAALQATLLGMLAVA